MVEMLSREEFGTMLERLAQEAGGQAALARRLGVTPATLNDIIKRKPPKHPGPTILGVLGYRKVVRYLKVTRPGRRSPPPA